MSRTAWTWARLAGAAVTLAVLVWRLGTGPFLDGVRTVDGRALAAAAGLAVLTTVCCAWRWKIVARGLGVDLPLPAAVAAYYRSLFLNVTLPGGVVGDVHRGVSHGRDVSDVGRGLRAVAWERSAGQVVQVVLTVVVLLVLPSPVQLVHAAGRDRARRGACSASCSWLGRDPAAVGPAWARVRRAAAGDIRDGLLARRAWLGIALASALVVAGHAVTFLIAARTAGIDRAAVPDAAAGAARAAGHGAAERRRLGAARGRGGLGVRRGRPGRGAGRRHRRRLRRHGARRQPAGRRRPRGGMAPSYPAAGRRAAAPVAGPGRRAAGRSAACLTARTPC